MEEHKGWYRGHNLPHLDGCGITQFITFRLADSVPQEAIEGLEEELVNLRHEERQVERIRRIELLLDQGSGSCMLRRSDCAEIVKNSLAFLDPDWYHLLEWVIMPNHVHLLARFEEGQSMPKALHSLKSYTANRINEVLSRSGTLWQDEYFDRYIRNEAHYWKTVNYIRENPVSARLCKQAEEYKWSSAHGGEGFQPLKS